MPSPLSVFVKHLLAEIGPESDGSSDGELLARFVKCRDSEALAVLVQRHAGMVWGVCCRHLHNAHDAEDAFQATFFVLVRKAAAVPKETIANWLYGVARQTSVRMRATAAKQARREMQVANLPEPPVPERENAELAEVVETELSRLPNHYRAVVILCDLEGLTRRDAAVQLGIPEGSVASRLARARELLTKRLDRRSIQFSLTLLALLSAKSVSSAPTALVLSLLASKQWDLLAAGQAAGVVSANIATLTEGVVKTMFITKVKSLLIVTLILGLALGVTGVGIRLSTHSGAIAQSPKPDAEKKKPEKPKPENTSSAKPNVDQEEAKILAALQGTWQVVKEDEDRPKFDGPSGVPVPEPNYRERRMVINGNTGTYEHKDGIFGNDLKWNFREKPMQIDMSYYNTTFQGIFKLEDGKLWICSSSTRRPTEFKANRNALTSLTIYERSPNITQHYNQVIKIPGVTIDQVDEKTKTISVSLRDRAKGTKLVHLPVNAETRVVAPKIYPGVDKNTPFRWNYLKGLQGEWGITLYLRVSDVGETVVSLVSKD